MVKTIEKHPCPNGRELGFVRMSGSELVNTIDNFGTEIASVTAKTEDHEFDSLDDMKANLPLLVGNVEVSIENVKEADNWGRLRIYFGYCLKIHQYGSLENKQSPFVEKIISSLSEYRIPLISRVSLIPVFVWFFLLFAGPFLTVEVATALFDIDETIQERRLLLASIVVFLSLLVTAVFLDSVNPIYFSTREKFFSRNKDKLLVGLIMLLVGLALPSLLSLIQGFFTN